VASCDEMWTEVSVVECAATTKTRQDLPM
jgi:hypothetical protein